MWREEEGNRPKGGLIIFLDYRSINGGGIRICRCDTYPKWYHVLKESRRKIAYPFHTTFRSSRFMPQVRRFDWSIPLPTPTFTALWCRFTRSILPSIYSNEIFNSSSQPTKKLGFVQSGKDSFLLAADTRSQGETILSRVFVRSPNARANWVPIRISSRNIRSMVSGGTRSCVCVERW